MRIICDSTKEYVELMKACEYLHDLELDTEKHPIIEDIRHLYMDKDDFPKFFGMAKKKLISIKGRKNLPGR
jgi:hypothetical protein